MTSPLRARSISSASSSGRPSTVNRISYTPRAATVPGPGAARTIGGVTDPHAAGPTGRVFRRAADPHPPVAVSGDGATVRDAAGREYIDAAGGAIVVGVGHGRASVATAMADQAGRL